MNRKIGGGGYQTTPKQPLACPSSACVRACLTRRPEKYNIAVSARVGPARSQSVRKADRPSTRELLARSADFCRGKAYVARAPRKIDTTPSSGALARAKKHGGRDAPTFVVSFVEKKRFKHRVWAGVCVRVCRVMLTAEYDGGYRAHDAEERAVDRVLFGGHY